MTRCVVGQLTPSSDHPTLSLKPMAGRESPYEAAPLSNAHRGLLEPARSDGGTRRYSSEDLERLRRIGDLVAAGVNLAGVAMVLDLEDANARLQADLDATDNF